MTEFRVLPVLYGDAATIRCRRGDYLFDGGIDGCGLPVMLKRRKIKRLRIAACTSSCRERLGGIFDLLESGYPVKELWLPEDIRELTAAAVAFNGDWQAWADITEGAVLPESFPPKTTTSRRPGGKSWWLHGAATLMELALIVCGSLPNGQTTDLCTQRDEIQTRFEAILRILAERSATPWHEGGYRSSLLGATTRLFANGGAASGLAVLCGKMLMDVAQRLPGGPERGKKALVNQLALTAMTAALLAEVVAKTTFFKGQGKLTDNLISGHPVKILNGRLAGKRPEPTGPVTPDAFFRLAKGAAGHQKSLVYQYGDSGCSVLLCGDSRFSFLGRQQTLFLDRPTAAMAPRQGSPSSDRAYQRIRSLAPHKNFWVRGASANGRKISNHFKESVNSLCLENCRHFAMQEVLLRHDGRQWLQLSGGICRD